MPLGAFLARLVLVEVRLGRRETELEDGLPALRHLQLRIGAEVPEQHHLVQTFGHRTLLGPPFLSYSDERMSTVGAGATSEKKSERDVS